MKIDTREKQLCFTQGYICRKNKIEFDAGVKWFEDNGYETNSVFSICPFNDSIDQILHTIEAKSRSQKDLVSSIIYVLQEYVFLVSDFQPPCCYDGRTFYCTTDLGVSLVCDRCDNLYSLEGIIITPASYRFMTKHDFLKNFPDLDESQWPYHKRLSKGEL